ncbi:dihydroxyacetone kinase subunit DhaL [Telmatospirillum siberiense]|uniref:Dihydroxyacetone kinase subunit L n=1 Tax=Telmatospirillum siberiense TaxID=382514 RepID=A0A2N3PTZ8_9PROT|nr:dihydroxyacetone kinase subunit DhaL [Telmatospirillum siberiense]PKU23879.1 dihydroxyacetone kinase subunit L [Telmatospirillum siberiense]
MQELTQAEMRVWIWEAAAVIDKNSALLCDLDAAIGDGDHGANMTRGFAAVLKKLEGGAVAGDLGAFFKTIGMTLLSTVGGAAGPLYGGFFLELGKQSAGRTSLDGPSLAVLIEAGLADIKRRGKAEPGDKTMVDALVPAVEAMKAAGGDLAAVTRAGAEAARLAATNTAPLQARKGRASYLGERSIGHQDPGANSAALLLESLARICSA